MNTVKSVGYGWGILVVAGCSAYYLAKRSINVDREARAQVELERRQRQEQLRQADRAAQFNSISSLPPVTSTPSVGTKFTSSASRSSESCTSPNASTSEGSSPPEKGKYEASEPWRSRKGDRLG